MTFAFHTGQYGVRLASTAAEVEQCQRLRHLSFFGAEGIDRDSHDDHCQHIMVASGQGLVATCRIQVFRSNLNFSYAAQRYDISSLLRFDCVMELGRFCIAPTANNPDILRLIWGAVTRIVDQENVQFLFGCPSFEGTDPNEYHAAFGLLADRHSVDFIGSRAPSIFRLSGFDWSHRAGLQQLPPLLRSYLTMGGWVSDHAVVDHELNTMHVFCGVEVDKIPNARAKSLRSIAR